MLACTAACVVLTRHCSVFAWIQFADVVSVFASCPPSSQLFVVVLARRLGNQAVSVANAALLSCCCGLLLLDAPCVTLSSFRYQFLPVIRTVRCCSVERLLLCALVLLETFCWSCLKRSVGLRQLSILGACLHRSLRCVDTSLFGVCLDPVC